MVIWQHYKRVMGIFSPRMRRNGYLGTSGQKSDPAICSGTSISNETDAFPLPSDDCGIYSMFLCYTVAWHVTLTFDLLTLCVSHVQCFSCPTHIPIFLILWLLVTEIRVLNIWSHFPYLKQSLRMHRVTWPVHRRSPNTTRNNFLTPNCLFTIQLLWGYDDD